MSLGCLTCKISRTDSTNELNSMKFNNVDKDDSKEKKHKASSKPGLEISVERSWSGNLAPKNRLDENMTHSLSAIPENKVKKGSRRFHSSGPIEFPADTPKLVRSPGIRRDWSFEDLSDSTLRFGKIGESMI